MPRAWYVVQVYSGFETKIAQQLLEHADRSGLADHIGNVLVPSERVTDQRGGRRTEVEQTIYPGYILVNMELTDVTWHLIKNTPKVTGFLGSRSKPIPISDTEAERIIKGASEKKNLSNVSSAYKVGEYVRVADGPFATFNGTVEEIDSARERLKVSVSIFGRLTPVELEFHQVERVS